MSSIPREHLPERDELHCMVFSLLECPYMTMSGYHVAERILDNLATEMNLLLVNTVLHARCEG